MIPDKPAQVAILHGLAHQTFHRGQVGVEEGVIFQCRRFFQRGNNGVAIPLVVDGLAARVLDAAQMLPFLPADVLRVSQSGRQGFMDEIVLNGHVLLMDNIPKGLDFCAVQPGKSPQPTCGALPAVP